MQAVWVRGSDTPILLPAVVELTTSAEIQDSPLPDAFTVAATTHDCAVFGICFSRTAQGNDGWRSTGRARQPSNSSVDVHRS